MMKICCKCRIEKCETEIHKANKHADGLASLCKPCAIAKTKQWCQDNRDRSNQQSRNWSKTNHEKRLLVQKQYRERNRDRLNHEARIRKSFNREERCKRQRERQKERMATDPIFALTRNLRGRFADALRNQSINKEISALKLLGCTIPELKQHLESKFQPGMTWENRGSVVLMNNGKPILDASGMTILAKRWNVDHIRPISSFNLFDIEQQKQCFHYTNLQPLWATDNISKGSKFLSEIV